MFRICSQWGIVSVIVLTGCAERPPVTDADRAKVERYIRQQQEPLSVTFGPMWYVEGDRPIMICGEIEAPGQLRQYRDRLRYIYYLNTKKPDGVIEMHELVVAGDERGQQIVAEGRSIFDKVWAQACAPGAPWSIGRWFGGTPTAGDGQTDTPLTNDYTRELLEKVR